MATMPFIRGFSIHSTVLRDGKIASFITSGNYGQFLRATIGMSYVPCKGESEVDVLASKYEIEAVGERFPAEASLKSIARPAIRADALTIVLGQICVARMKLNFENDRMGESKLPVRHSDHCQWNEHSA